MDDQRKSPAVNRASQNNIEHNNSTKNTVLLQAQELIEKGYSVILMHSVYNGNCTCGHVNCSSPGKHSIGGWKEFQERRKTLNEISQDFQKHPYANIGIVTGKISGIFILDIDGHDGENFLKELEAINGLLPKTVEVITGSGGRHIYFKYPKHTDIRNSASTIGKNLDIRGNGGMIVCPPSLHKSGNQYEWSPDCASELADAPKWLLDLINTNQDKVSREKAKWEDMFNGIPEGQRNQVMASMAGKLAHSGMKESQALQVCLSLNKTHNEPPLPESEIVSILKSIFTINRSKAELDRSEVELRCIDDVEMVPIQWLWEDRIALGKLTVIAGQPGLGKSQITAMLCAHLTSETPFPDGARADRGSVIIISAEDDVADTVKPRLIAAGADLKRCHFLDGIKTDINGETATRLFALEQDIELLEDTLKANKDIRLIIIDPVSAYHGKTDGHGNAEIRSLLMPYSKLAAQYNVAIVLVTHFNKSSSQEPLERVIGSIGLIAAARAGYAVIKDAEKDELRYFVPLKNNIGNDKGGFSFHVEGVHFEDGIKTSRIVWGATPVSAKEVLNPEKKTQTNGASEFLSDLLSNGPVLTAEIFENGDCVGYSKSSLQRAKNRLGILHRKLGYDQGGVWFLPEHEDRVMEMMKSS